MEPCFGLQQTLVAFCCIKEKPSCVLITEQTIKEFFEKWARVRLVAIFQHHPATKAFVEFETAQAIAALVGRFAAPQATPLGRVTLTESRKKRVVSKQSFRSPRDGPHRTLERVGLGHQLPFDDEACSFNWQSCEAIRRTTRDFPQNAHQSPEIFAEACLSKRQNSQRSDQVLITADDSSKFKQMYPPNQFELFHEFRQTPLAEISNNAVDGSCLVEFEELNCEVVDCRALANLVGQFAPPRSIILDKLSQTAWVELPSAADALHTLRGLDRLIFFSRPVKAKIHPDRKLSPPEALPKLAAYLEARTYNLQARAFPQEGGVVFPTRTLRISNLSDNCSTVVLLSLMSQVNEPVGLRHVWRQGVASSRVLFAEFATPDRAAEVLAVLAEKIVDGRPLRVAFVTESCKLYSETNV